jgi:hypothetical protein
MGERPRDWIRLLPPTVRRDPRVTVLSERLSTLHDAGAGVERLLRTAGRPPRPLPAEQPADALGWRIVGEEARHRSTGLGGAARSVSGCDVETEGHAAACLLDLHSVSLT